MNDETMRELVLKLYLSDHHDNAIPLYDLDVRRLIHLLSDEANEMRAAAAYTLEALWARNRRSEKPGGVVNALSDLLLEEQDFEVRRHAIEALSHVTHATAISALIATFVANNDYDALYAINPSLESVRPILEEKLLQDQTAICFRSAYALARMYFRSEPLERIMSWLADERSNHRLPAIFALENHKSAESQRILLETSKTDPQPCARAAAIHVLHLNSEKADLDPFISGLSDPDPKVRSEAAWALKYRAQAIYISSNPTFYSTAIGSLIAALSDENELVREYAADALRGGIRYPGLFERLSTMLSDPHPKVRRVAIFAVGDYGDQAAKNVLQDFLGKQEPDSDDASTAEYLLGRLNR